MGGSGLEGRELGAAVLETEPLRERPWPWRAARGGVAMGDLGNMGISVVGVSGLVWLGRRDAVLASSDCGDTHSAACDRGSSSLGNAGVRMNGY